MNIEREIGEPSVLHLTNTEKPGRSLCGKPTSETDIAVTSWNRRPDAQEGNVTFCSACEALAQPAPAPA